MATMLLCKGGSGSGGDAPHVPKPAPAPLPALTVHLWVSDVVDGSPNTGVHPSEARRIPLPNSASIAAVSWRWQTKRSRTIIQAAGAAHRTRHFGDSHPPPPRQAQLAAAPPTSWQPAVITQYGLEAQDSAGTRPPV